MMSLQLQAIREQMEAFESSKTGGVGSSTGTTPLAAMVAAAEEDPFGPSPKERGPSFGSWASSPTPVH